MEPKSFIKSCEYACPFSRDTIHFKAILCTNKGNHCLHRQEKPMGTCFPALGGWTTGKDRGEYGSL